MKTTQNRNNVMHCVQEKKKPSRTQNKFGIYPKNKFRYDQLRPISGFSFWVYLTISKKGRVLTISQRRKKC